MKLWLPIPTAFAIATTTEQRTSEITVK